MDLLLTILFAFFLGFLLILFFKKSSPQITEESVKEDDDVNRKFEKIINSREKMVESVISVIKNLGVEVEDIIEKSDGHVLIRAINKTPVVGGKFLFECVWRGRVFDAESVNNFKDFLKGEDISKGTIFCFDEISKEARRICEDSNIEIYDKKTFLKLLKNEIICGNSQNDTDNSGF